MNTTYFIGLNVNLHKARNVLYEEGEEITEDSKAKTQHSDTKSNVEQFGYFLPNQMLSNVEQVFVNLAS